MRWPVAAALLFPLLSACGTDSADGSPTTGREPRLLVVGWDGASFLAIDPLLAAGKLPHLAGLIARGARAPLESTIVPISSAAWTTATTGKGAGETGVFSFFEPVPGSTDLTLVSSRSNHAAPLWRLLTGRGLRSFVFGVPLTYPPEPLLGTMVCGMLAPREADYAWPAGLAERLRARGYLPDIDPWLEEREPTWAEAEAQLDLREELLGELLPAEDWRLAWIVFKELDVLAHFSSGIDFEKEVAPIYERLDALLGTLLALVGPETNVIVLSDHGFSTYEQGFNLHAWLAEQGFSQRRADAETGPLPGGPFARRMAAEAAQRLDELDLARTTAYAFACEGNFGSVRLHLAGREPAGTLAPSEIQATLGALEFALRQHPAIARTARATELLPGPERAALPDLLIEARPGIQVFAEPGTEVFGRYPEPVPDHDLTGIFVAAGPAFLHDVSPRRLRLVDMAPLALHLLALPVPEEMHGSVPLTLMNERRTPLRVPEASFAAVRPAAAGAVYTNAEIQTLEHDLRALGYSR